MARWPFLHVETSYYASIGRWIVSYKHIEHLHVCFICMHLAETQATQLQKQKERGREISFHLAFHQHGHVHEHVVKLPDTVFQLDNLIVPRLDLIHRLLGDVVHNYLRRYKIKEVVTDRCAPTAFFLFCFFVRLTPEVKMAGLSLSNMLSSSSFVVFLPAKKAKRTNFKKRPPACLNF